MPFSVRCDGCGQSLNVPDDKSGTRLPCPRCGAEVMAEPPLMPPPVPGSGPAATLKTPATPTVSVRSSTPVDAGSGENTKFAAPASSMPASTAPPVRSSQVAPGSAAPPPTSAPSPPVGTTPTTAPPPAPPPHHDAPSPRGVGYELETHESLERAVKLQRTGRGAWIAPLVLVLLTIFILGGYLFKKWTTLNPALPAVEKSVRPAPSALKEMSEQTGSGYTFYLPRGFVPGSAPSIGKLPDSTVSYCWEAPQDSEDKGCELRIWVIPKELDLKKHMKGLDNVSNWIGYSAHVSDKSSYRRLGGRMLCVNAHVDGSTEQSTRRGVIYLIVDGNRTIMALGMAVGGNWQQLRYWLDSSIKSIRRAEDT
ncbi:MAG: hypothetical protein VB875_19200 [Pirellulales bacterium]